MNRRVAAGSPARSDLQLFRMIRVADVNGLAGCLDLCVAAHAKIRITVDEHFLVDRTVRSMTGDAAFAHRLVFKNKRARLVAMALGAAFIMPRHGQPARRFENIAAMGIVALPAIHVAFDDRVMLGQIKFRVDVEMTLKTGRRILARVDDEPDAAAGLDVFAARPVTGFAAGLADHRRIVRMNPRVRAGGKLSDDVLVAIGAGLIADIVRAGNFQRSHHGVGRGGTGIQKQHQRTAGEAQSGCHGQCPLHFHCF